MPGGLAQPKGFLHALAIKKTAGQVSPGPALNTQTNFPLVSVMPRNPDNIGYPSVMNASGAPTVSVAGKKTPSIMLSGIPAKASWLFGAAGMKLLNDLIGADPSYLDSGKNTSEYAVGVQDDAGVFTVYDGGKCSQLILTQTAEGGPILLDMAWLCIYGDNEKSTPTSFSAVTTDAGTEFDVTNATWATVDAPYLWRLTIMRPQGYQRQTDGTLYMSSIESGMIGGNLRLVQNANPSAVVATTAATLQINPGAGNGIQIALNLKRDERQADKTASLLAAVRDYTLFAASGAYPIAITNV